MQWGSRPPTCQSFSARFPRPSLQPHTKRCRPKQAYQSQSLTPRCSQPLSCPLAIPANCDGASSVALTSCSPPRRARLKPPLKPQLLAVIVGIIYACLLVPTVLSEENSTQSSAVKYKLRVYPAARQAIPVRTQVEFECTGGQPPYLWEYHIQDEQLMNGWRYYIRHNRDNCLLGVNNRTITATDRVHANASTGRLTFDWTEVNDTGIYRCFSASNSGCVELHLLVFEPTSYMFHIRLIYGLFAIVIFVASLSTAWQLWNSSAFHRKAMARSRSNETGKIVGGSPHNTSNGGYGGPAAALNPVMRFFSRSRSSSANKPSAVATDDAAQWPVLRRRLSSIDDSPPQAVVAVPIPVEVISSEEQIRVAMENHHLAPPS